MYFNGTKCQLFIFSCLLSVSAFAKDLKTMQAEGIRKPLCFVENKGQVLDENNHSRTDVQFKLSGKGVSLFVGNAQLHYQFKDVVAGPKSPTISTYRMDVTLLGADEHVVATTSEMIDYHENYYIPQVGPEGITVSAYQKITYTNVYPNIDWVLYVKDGKVEYDFVVRPGGDPNQIKLQYGGATDLSIGADGSITAKTPMGNVTEKTPVAFETRTHKAVSSRFKLDGNIVSFATGKYNGSLTIDPYLAWSTYFGGTNEDVVTSIKTSTGGNIYATGYTASTGLASNTTPLSAFSGGGYDAFIVKYPAGGFIVTWATYIGGTGEDKGMSLGLDNLSSGVYMGGTTTTTGTTLAFPVATAYQNNNNGGKDMFLLKINNTTGIRTWSTYVGGSADDEGLAVICDSIATSNVYIAGKTLSGDMVTTDGTMNNGAQDGYMAKFSSTGTNVWATYIGGEGDDEIDAMAVNNNVFIAATGWTNSTTGIALSGTLSGIDDGFLTYIKANSIDPLVQWSTYIGGSNSDIGKGLASDAAHNIYLVGTTSSADGISSGVSYTNALGGSQDAYLMKYNNTGTKIWGTYFGGAADDLGNGVCTDQFGNITIAGATSSPGIASAGAYQTTLNGTTDAFVAKYNTLGQKLYSTYFGRAGADFATCLIAESAVSATASAISIGGSTNSAALSTTGAAQTAYGGSNDGFVAKFLRDTIVTIKQPFIDTLLCPGATFTIRDTVNFNFGTGNIFRVQLSDATGTFATSFTPIGTVSASSNANITCTIPVGTPTGTGYRIRIVSTNPVFASADNNINISVVSSVPAPSINGNSPVCVGFPLNLSSSAPYAINGYNWSGPGAFSSTQQNPTIPSVTAANGGTYTVSVTHNGCPPSTNSINILVNSFIPPTPSDSSNSPLCLGGTLNLFGRSDYPGIFTYHWSGPAGYTSTMQNPVRPGITPADTGMYYLVDTLDGCPSLADVVHVTTFNTDTPNIMITVTPDDTVCMGTTLHFNATVTNAGFSPMYQWMTGPVTPIVGAIFDNWSVVSPTSGTTIWCRLTGSVVCPDKPHDTSNVITVIVLNNTPTALIYATPDTVVSPGATVTFHASYTGSSLVGYTWYVNNVPVPGVTSSTYTISGITHNDTVRFEVASNAVCGTIGVSNTIVIHVHTVGIGNVSPEFENIDLFPNPNNGSFTIKGLLDNISEGNVTVDVSNAIGQVVYSTTTAITNSQLEQQVQMKDLPAGIYLLRLNKDGLGKVFRFVVE